MAVGLLLDTFLVRGTLVPALVHLLGRWTWWPWGMAAGGGESVLIPEAGARTAQE